MFRIWNYVFRHKSGTKILLKTAPMHCCALCTAVVVCGGAAACGAAAAARAIWTRTMAAQS